MKRLTDADRKYNEAAVDNRVLKADIETLRAKVSLLSVPLANCFPRQALRIAG